MNELWKGFYDIWALSRRIIKLLLKKLNKDDIYITNECTRNAILKFLHKEIPYNIKIKNTLFKYLKNNDLKIKQSIELDNKRYKPIILGKNGNTIKRIRECSQKDIKSIINNNIHLYLQIDTKNAK